MATTVEVETRFDSSEVETGINKFRELKKELLAAKGELAGLEAGTEEFVKTSQKVGQIKNKIDDLNASIKATSGAPVENLTGSFALLTDKVRTLNFGEATSALKQFGASVAGTNIKSLTSGLKDFGKEMLNVAKAIITNPIFLLSALIAGIVYAIYTFATANKQLTQSLEDVNRNIKLQIDLQADLLRATETTQSLIIEKMKQRGATEAEINKAIVENNRHKLELLKKNEQNFFAELEEFQKGFYKRTEDLSDEDRKKEDDKLKALTDAYQKAKQDRVKFTDAALIEEEKLRTAAIQKEKERIKKEADQRIADEKKLQKQIADERTAAFLASIKDEEVRANSAANIRFTERNKDIQDSKAGAAVKSEALKASEVQLHTDLAAITKQFNDKRKAEAEKLAAEEKARNEKIAQENKALGIKAVDELIARQNASHEFELSQIDNNNLLKLEKQRLFLEESRQLELLQAEQTGADVDTINIKYATAELELKKQVSEEKKKIREGEQQIEDNYFSALQSLAGAFFQGQLNMAHGNAKAELEIRKKQFAVEKAFAVSRVIIDGIRAVESTLANVPYPLNIGLAISQGVLAAANVAKILATKFDGGTASAPTSSAPTGGAPVSSGTPRGAEGPTSFQAQPVTPQGQKQEQLNKVYVLEADIRQVANRVKVTEARATFSL